MVIAGSGQPPQKIERLDLDKHCPGQAQPRAPTDAAAPTALHHGLLCDVAGSTIDTVTTAAKLLAAMRRNPLDWQIAQLQTVARQSGIEWRHEGSSHCIFVQRDGRTLPVPAHRPIKPIYVRKFIQLVDGSDP